MSVIVSQEAVDSQYQRHACDDVYDVPVDMSMTNESPLQTYPGCFGLPYQDHNYGALPPATPPQSPPLVATPIKEPEVKEDIIVTADVTPSDIFNPASPPSIDNTLDQDDPTRCICDFIHDDGYMIQCDKCSVWQHIVCMGLDRDSIPDVYFCEECKPRPVDRARAKKFQIQKREFLKSLVIKSHDSSTDTDPEEVNNRLKAYGLDQSNAANNKPKQKIKLKKRKERTDSRTAKRIKSKELKIEKENTSNEANRKSKLLVKDFSTKSAQQRKEKLSKKIERMRAERLSKEMVEDKLSSDDLRDDDKLINTISSPMVYDENAQNPWNISAFNEWEENYESARYNQYTTYVQEYLNSSCINGHHNDIADLVTDGLRVQRCHVKNLKNKKKGLESSCAIPNSQPVIEVIGKVMTKQQYDKDNYGQRQLSPFVFFYGNVFELDLVIDASDYGNDARFIRRSCQPNATVRHVVAGGQAHFITVATKEIPENVEITIPFDYDYKKWNFCVECACLRNNCPVTRYQKRRLRFQKMQNGDTSPRKSSKFNQVPKLTIKSPTKSPTKSPIASPPVKSPEKAPMLSPSADTIHVNPPTTSSTKMLRRSQVTKTSSQSAIICSAKVPSQTREERKMEAIMKAFEKMEKRNARKASVDQQQKGKDQKEHTVKEKVKEENEIKTEIKKDKPVPSVVEEVKEEEVVEVKQEKIASPQESPVKASASTVEVKVEEKAEVKEEVMEVETTTDDKPDIEKPAPIDKPQPTIDKPQTTKGKKAKKTGGRRRTRNSSGAGSTDTPAVIELQEENSSSIPPPTPLTISCPTTPAPTPTIETTNIDTPPPSFKFLKTKRHLMNEWLTEKKEEENSKPVRTEPLEVTVEENMFVTCLPSPRNSMDRLRRNSQTAGVRERSASLHGENNAGSAKKRWLRQAMDEECETTTATSPISGSGAQSPNPHITVQLHSPDGSPPVGKLFSIVSPHQTEAHDFVTPLKKRRLARESLSIDSTPGESPAQTPIPSSSITASTSYFSSLTESFETFKNRNGITSFFSPVKEEITESNQEELMEIVNEEVHSNVTIADEISCIEATAVVSTCEPSVNHDGDNSKDSVSSCSEDIIGPDSGDTGTSTEQTNVVQISNSLDRSFSDSMDNQEVLTTSEQNNECDQPCKSARTNTLEPDSSDNVREIECDSGISEPPAQSSGTDSEHLVTAGEVDSTECESSRQSDNSRLVSSAEQSSLHLENNQCDSCNSEKRDIVETLGQSAGSQVDLVEPSCSSAVPGPSNEDKLCISSSSPLSTSIHLNNVPTHPSSLQTLDKLSHVDSSTDKPTLQSQTNSANSVSGSLLEHSSITNSTTNHSLVDNGFRSVLDNEVSNSVNLANIQSNFTVPLKTATEAFLVTSNTGSSVDVTPTQNRHLKFLNDSNYSMDMTVDSTTLPGVGASNMLHSGFPSASSQGYDSDSMDVTSASEPSYGLGADDGRRLSDESLHSFPDALSSSSNDCQPPKERKKVSLQEYLKRKKVKTSTVTTNSTSIPVSPPVSATPGPSRSSVSSTTTTSPLKLSTLISLDKLDKKIQPLPSLPSLPMFEKTERKEFKSSSDLLSPIFNRKEKQEEVRKPMSLSERLRQEFGLDDTVNDTETESKTDQVGGSSKTADAPPPPPPPPPPQPMSRSARIISDSATFPVVKAVSNTLFKGVGESGSGLLGGVPHMVPPQSSSKLPNSSLSNSKSPIQATAMNMFTSMKLSHGIDLKSQLAVLKAQISKVQKYTSLSASSEQPANGQLPASTTLPQVFDYGHQSSAIFSRQNSCPASTNDNQSASVSSSKAKYVNYKTPPQSNSSGFTSANCVSQNGSSNVHENSSVWIYKSTSNGGNGKSKFSSSGRKHFEKQFSNKY